MNINTLPRLQKQLLILATDMLCLFVAIWLGFSLRLGELYSIDIELVKVLLLASIVTIPVFISIGLYRAVIRYIGIKALWTVFQAITLSVVIWGMLVISFDFDMPRSVPIIVWLILLVLVGGSRILARSFIARIEINKNQKNIIIYGAGKAGVQLAKVLECTSNMRLLGFIDDSRELHNKQVLGVKVYGLSSLEGSALKISDKKQLEIDEVLIAIPSASVTERADIVKNLEASSIRVKTLPDLSELTEGKISLDNIKEVDISDLLGRDPVEPNNSLLHLNIENKVVLITGAGGSIGSELCRQVVELQPKMIALLDMSELALYQIEKELLGLLRKKQYLKNIEIQPILGSVVDQKRVERVCSTFGVQTIYHAAAYKHVPMVEKNISEGVRNNIFGTFHCAQAAVNTGVETFVLISTDKAVRPTNVMGATKRFSELILQGLSLAEQKKKTCFTMVRFGNVLGSSGSVLPLFREQIAKDKTITVTDAKIIRYFMSIPEASQLVIQAGAMGRGGDVFVLDMGEPVKILDLAKRMIHLSGYQIKDVDNPQGDIEICFTGLRPGEKLYEELLIGDNVSKTEHPLISRAKENVVGWNKMLRIIGELNKALSQSDEHKLRYILQQAVEGYKPQCEIVDVLYESQKREANSFMLKRVV